MITEYDLRAAIAECQGERSPNANTCMKLAAYYTILNELQKDNISGASYAPPPEVISYQSDTDFMRAVKDKPVDFILELADELMSVLQVVNPRLYQGVMSKL